MCEPRFGGGAEYQLQSQVILVELSKADTSASWSSPLANMPRFLPAAGFEEGTGYDDEADGATDVGSTAAELFTGEGIDALAGWLAEAGSFGCGTDVGMIFDVVGLTSVAAGSVVVGTVVCGNETGVTTEDPCSGDSAAVDAGSGVEEGTEGAGTTGALLTPPWERVTVT